MFDSIISYVSAIASPSMVAASASYCMVNGREVDCAGFGGPILAMLGSIWLIALAFVVLMLVSNWMIYKKAGKPGWTSLIPIYNVVILLEIVGKPLWWIILMFIPVVNIIVSIIIVHRLSRSFGKDVFFTLGMLLLTFIFIRCWPLVRRNIALCWIQILLLQAPILFRHKLRL